MAPKSKRTRNVLSISEKIKIINMIEVEKKSVSVVARMYNKNESSIREVLKNKDRIRSSFSTAPDTAKVASTVRDKTLVKVEKALNLWVEDMMRKKMPINSIVLREKALSLYKDMKPENEEERDDKLFAASKGWLHRFRKRYNLKNIKITGESASADVEAATLFPPQLQKIISEKNYHPKQIFNCDETALAWKKMPQRTYVHKSCRQMGGYKAFKERLTLIFCANAAGHIIKPGVVYRVKNPRALKNKNKDSLPVFWQSNSKAWVTTVLFTEWFNQCFIKEVKNYLKNEGLPFKVLLVIDNAPGHPTSLMTEDENVEVVFLPPNTTALLQPLDQGVIRCFKAVYTRQVFDMIRSKVENSDSTGVMECWKSFTIADAIVFIKEAVDFLKPEMITACWKKLLSNVACNCQDTNVIDNQITTIIQTAKNIGGEGFDDMTEDELNEHFNDNLEVLTNEELKNLVISSGEESDEDETQEPPASWTLDKFAKVFRTAQTLKDQIMDYDPMMERSINITRKITEAMEPLQKLFDELKIQKKQLPITMFLEKIDENSSDNDH